MLPYQIPIVSTADLLSELMSRYREGIFIGIGPVRDGERADVRTKLDKRTKLGGILAAVVTKISPQALGGKRLSLGHSSLGLIGQPDMNRSG